MTTALTACIPLVAGGMTSNLLTTDRLRRVPNWKTSIELRALNRITCNR
jgi:hypothetical protein